jgi:serine/threonine protein kinase
VALKILEKKKFSRIDDGVETLVNEIRAHWALEQCDGVLKILSIHEDKNFVVLVLEYQPKGSLMQNLKNDKKFTEVEVRVIMEQILLVLDFFQQKKIVHRDIKPDNILVQSIHDKGKHYEVKVADLGLATQTPNDAPIFAKCGTPGYIAPEIFSNGGKGYSYKVDVFSGASVFFNLLTGYYIFNADNAEAMILSNRLCRTERIIPYIK